MYKFRLIGCLFTCIGLLTTAGPLIADELRIKIHGVTDPLLANVRTSVEPFRLTPNVNLSEQQLEDRRQVSEQQARVALRPFGYYHATVRSEVSLIEKGLWRLDIHIDRGPPVRISDVSLDIKGPGAELDDLTRWKSDWPLLEGEILNQQKWDAQKRASSEHHRRQWLPVGRLFTQQDGR